MLNQIKVGFDFDNYAMTAARAAARMAHCPYSKFHVGCIAIFDIPEEGRPTTAVVTLGCNVENASYGLTICSERNAIFAAVALGGTRLDVLYVTCPSALDADIRFRMPCGACRQVIAEFAHPRTKIYVDGVPPTTWSIEDLLPRPFKI